jgi:uncharacterized RDD family membrane protein YckC
VHCEACGAQNGYRNRACKRCGEPLSPVPLIRLLFAADPSAVGQSLSPRPPDLASFRSRLLAATLDITFMFVALFSIGAIGHDPAFGSDGPVLRLVVRLIAVAAVLAHPVLLEGPSGQTFGKRLVGIRVVNEETRGPIGYRAAAHRAGARAVFWMVSFLALTDPRYQTLHDRSAGTLVVKVDAPVPPTGRSEQIEYEPTDDA